MEQGILNGIRVIDLTRYIAGPYCGALLADMGAEVIKIEKPEGEATRRVAPYYNGVSLFYPPYNRNKKSVTADMRTPEGIEIAKKLIASADVLLENFRAGTMEKMGLGYEEVKKINPGIIMVSITGFGQTGPLRDRPAFDGIVSAMSGVTRMEKGRIERGKGPINDCFAAVYAAYGTMLALYEKQMTGKGQYIDVSMLACSSMVRTSSIADGALNGDEAAVNGDEAAPYGYLKGTDGWVNFHAGTNRFYDNLLKIIDDPYLREERFIGSIANRLEEVDEIIAHIQSWADGKTCKELEQIFIEAGIPVGIVATPSGIRNNEQLVANGYIIEQEVHGIEGKVPFMGFPFRLSNHENIEYRPAPAIGENTDEIYGSVLGMGAEEIEELRSRGIV